MDAFEQLVAEILFDQGYWVQTSVKVDLTKEEKRRIERHSSPRWEIDVVAYRAADNELLVVECKSYLDSRGVQWTELQDGYSNTRYKLFKEPVLRDVVFGRLAAQMVESGRCAPGVSVTLGMAAGKIKAGDQEDMERHFAERGWRFYGPDWLRERLEEMSAGGYTNQISSVVAKLLLRSPSVASTRPQTARVGSTSQAMTLSSRVKSLWRRLGSRRRWTRRLPFPDRSACGVQIAAVASGFTGPACTACERT